MRTFLGRSQSLLVAIFSAIGRRRIVTRSDAFLPASTACFAANTPTGPLTVVSIHQTVLHLAWFDLDVGAYFSAVSTTMERGRVGAGASPCFGSFATGR